jgi:hypothetical protein
MTEKSKHWLVRAKTIRFLWILFIVVLILLLIPDFYIHQHAHFGLEATFGFYAWYGFGTCVAMVVVAKLLGIFLKRKDTYYDPD